jgi:aryl carrier-like protein
MLCSVSEKEKKIIASCLANENAYNIPLFIKFNQGMNIERMTEILTELLQQYKIFQTTFQIDECSLEKKIGSIPNIAIEEMTARDKEHIYQKNLISIQDVQLMKIILCKIKDRSYDYLFMNIHHVLMDGFSTNLFLKEIISRYTSNTSLGMISEKKIDVESEASQSNNTFCFNGYDCFKAQLQTKKIFGGQQVSLHRKLNLARKKYNKYSDFSNNLSAFSLSVAEWLGLEQAYLAYPSLGRNRNNYHSLGNFVELVPFQYKFDRKSNETKKMLIQSIQEQAIKNAADKDFFETVKRNNGTSSLDIFNSIVFDYKSTSLINRVLDEDQQIVLEEEEAYIDQKFDLHFVVYKSEKDLELTILSNEFPQTELEELMTIFEQKLQQIYSDKDITVQELLIESQEITQREKNEEQSIAGDMVITLKEMILSLIDEEELDEEESFFDLGIDSLLLVKLKKEIKQTFAVTLKISDFFNNYTVSLLAEKITIKRMEENDR